MEVHQPKPDPSWIELPRDVAENILHRLDTKDILESAQKVCTTWWRVLKDPLFWRVIDMTNNAGSYDAGQHDHQILLCRQAVDRSQGQAVDISIDHFCTDQLLLYISQRCGQLKCLRLASCSRLSGKSLSEAAKKLIHLEELHIHFIPLISDSDVETIGESCPMLKSFTYSEYNDYYPLIKDDEYAFAVARNMPRLRHLKLFGNAMTDDGLRAILDGCSHLESLDLRRCSNVVIEGDIEKRCSRQIKYLRRPSDTVNGGEWAEIYHFQSFNHANNPFYYDANTQFGFCYS